ncbi:MAG TPA: hypothetical protein VJR03_12630 [Nitrospira sp.]|nr:hypothetical protein [Nitrospira sp.]
MLRSVVDEDEHAEIGHAWRGMKQWDSSIGVWSGQAQDARNQPAALAATD